MYKVYEKYNGQYKVFSKTREVSAYLLGRKLEDYYIFKLNWDRVDLSDLKDFSTNSLEDYLEEY